MVSKITITIARASISSEHQATQVVRPAEQSITTGCSSNAPKVSEPRSVAPTVVQAARPSTNEGKNVFISTFLNNTNT